MKNGGAAKPSLKERAKTGAKEFLICAKFVLIGRMIHLGERFNKLPLIWPTLHRSFVFVVFLTALNALEEIIVGLIHHRSVVDALADIEGGPLQRVTAVSLVVMLILFPFFAFQSLGELLGQRNLIRVLTQPRHTVAATRH